jgi:hypothetical protein
LELYDLHTDPGEAVDVVAQHPQTIAKIEGYLKTAREESVGWPFREAPLRRAAASH